MVSCAAVVDSNDQVSVFGSRLSGWKNSLMLLLWLRHFNLLAISCHILDLCLVQHYWLFLAWIDWMKLLQLERLQMLKLLVLGSDFKLGRHGCGPLYLNFSWLKPVLRVEIVPLVDSLHLDLICQLVGALAAVQLCWEGLLHKLGAWVPGILHLDEFATVHECLLLGAWLLTDKLLWPSYRARLGWRPRCIVTVARVSLIEQWKLLGLQRLVAALLRLRVVTLRLGVVLRHRFQIVLVEFGRCLHWLDQMVLLGSCTDSALVQRLPRLKHLQSRGGVHCLWPDSGISTIAGAAQRPWSITAASNDELLLRLLHAIWVTPTCDESIC